MSKHNIGKIDWYEKNPMTVRSRRLSRSTSSWARAFTCEDVIPLIVCRGPIRKEAMDVFEQMGIMDYGILLSEKDSIVYTQALAPELRRMRPEHVHRVKDYTGATKEERTQRVRQIIDIARRGGYTHVFAGYGFMAEDESFVRALEDAGLGFIGPRSSVQAAAGHKDEAKRTALREQVSVTPGIDDVTVRVLLGKHPDLAALRLAATAAGLEVPALLADGAGQDLRAAAEATLQAAYEAGIDLYTIDELAAEIERCAALLLHEHPWQRIRLKAIGGGGGKGQRLLQGDAAQAPALVREILAEVKAAGVGDNKNILLELNIEETRHNEIQLVGNGSWCVSLGGRDCSLQMHEQKLLEVSLTREGLLGAAAAAQKAGREVEARSLMQEVETLAQMEAEAERFGLAVGLNSASTFECIVSGPHHYFMEVNTRIQVEHRVSELCYTLRFTNPDDPTDHFDVSSLVECMVLLARHGARLPRPTRLLREGAALEVRMNATDRALQPHAGGAILSWSDPIDHEIRDDQGICVKNPDTGVFIVYRLAGAYDSNIALLVTYGEDRRESYERLGEIVRRTKLRGVDLQTNVEFLYGLLQWFLAQGVWAKPTTRFVVPYLTQVALLFEEAGRIDLGHAWTQLCAARERAARPEGAAFHKAVARALSLKETLVKRPLERLFRDPHLLSAWLSAHRQDYVVAGGRVRWLRNPVDVLHDTYRLLNMDDQPHAPAAHVIWDHDNEILQKARRFYAGLTERLSSGWPRQRVLLQKDEPPPGWGAGAEELLLWQQVRAASAGFQLGLEVLDILPLLGERAGFFELRVGEDLSVTIPARLLDPTLQARAKKILAPPPVARGSEIVAQSGGMFYSRESPDRPPFVKKGDHFEAGQALYIVEVMKMFNKVHAPFAGTIEDILMDGADGTIVQKGQPLFRVRPDEAIVVEDPVEVARRVQENTDTYLAALL